METNVFHSIDRPLSLEQLVARPEPLQVLMCSPDYFDIIDVKNVYMEEGKKSFDKATALRQWESLMETYEMLVAEGMLKQVHVLPGVSGCEDMVFAANQSFPWITKQGDLICVPSHMKHESRRREVPYFTAFYHQQGYEIRSLSSNTLFEGMGDAIPHPNKRLIYGGYGHRTDASVYQELVSIIDAPIITLELSSAHFYHLDTCFVPLSSTSVMICSQAFTAASLATIHQCFEKVYEISFEEAQHFSLNAHVMPSILVAILQKGNPQTVHTLKQEGYRVIELDTSEFMKSGGSVFCMKMMIY